MQITNYIPGVSQPTPVTKARFVFPAFWRALARLYDFLILDVSGSMGDPGFESGMTKLMLVYEAVLSFLHQKRELRPNDYVAIACYSTTATLCCPFLSVSHQFDELAQALEMMLTLPHEDTFIGEALCIANSLFESTIPRQDFPCGQVLNRVIAYSDGQDHRKDTGRIWADRIKVQNVLIETMGIEVCPSKVDEAFLKAICTTDEDGHVHYKFLGDADAVTNTFKKLATVPLVCME